MRRTLACISLILGCGLVFSSCTKEKSYEPGTMNTGGNNNGGANNGGTNNNGGSNNGGTDNGGGTNNGGAITDGLAFQLDNGAKQSTCAISGDEDLGGQHAYVFSGTTADGNVVTVTVFVSNIKTGQTYTQANTGTSVGLVNVNTGIGMGVVINSNSNVSITFTQWTDTDYAFTFSGRMIVTLGGSGAHTISGTVKGKRNQTTCAAP